jgi:hypothetical protein
MVVSSLWAQRNVKRALCLVLFCASCNTPEGAVYLSDGFECVPRPDDSTGYLQPICLFLQERYRLYDVNPNTLTIESIVPGNEWELTESPFANEAYDFVELSCCYTGDWAVIDRDRVVVSDFIFGDK